MKEDEIVFYGHRNVRCDHSRAIEITKSKYLTIRGDCILGVNADKSCCDLDVTLKKMIMEDGSVIRLQLFVQNLEVEFCSLGSSRLSLLDNQDIVIRKTNYMCPRTLSICCDKASSDIPRDVVELLRDSTTKAVLRIGIE